MFNYIWMSNTNGKCRKVIQQIRIIHIVNNNIYILCINIYIYIYTYIYIYIYLFTYIFTYVYTYTYIYIYDMYIYMNHEDNIVSIYSKYYSTYVCIFIYIIDYTRYHNIPPGRTFAQSFIRGLVTL